MAMMCRPIMDGAGLVRTEGVRGYSRVTSPCLVLCGRFLLALFGLLTLPTFSLPAQPLHFAREKISIFVTDNEVRLSGDYHFRNPLPRGVQATLLYPFPVRDAQPFPDSITVKDVLARAPVVFREMDSAIVFSVNLPPLSTRIYRVSFRQEVRVCRFEYILTTTHRWSSPVESAEFIITLDKDLILEHINLSAEEHVQHNGARVLRIKDTNFRPNQNLVIEWMKKLL